MSDSRGFGELDLGLPARHDGDALPSVESLHHTGPRAFDATDVGASHLEARFDDDETLPPPPTMPPHDEEPWLFGLEAPIEDDAVTNASGAPQVWSPRIALMPPPMVIAVGDGVTIGRSHPLGSHAVEPHAFDSHAVESCAVDSQRESC